MRPLPCGVRRAQLGSNAVQLGFPALVRGIMGGLRCADQETERDCSSGCVCVCLFGRRHASVKSSPNARLFFLLKTLQIFLRSAHLPRTTVVLFACKCVRIPLLSQSRAPTEGSLCVHRLYCYHVCPQPPQFRLLLGNDLTNRSAADLRSISVAGAIKHLEASATARLLRPAYHVCATLCKSYNTAPSDLVKHISTLIQNDSLSSSSPMNHTHSSGDFLF